MTAAKELDMETPVVILGVHRSGTSLLTRMLEKIGLFVGNDLQGDHESTIMIQVNNSFFVDKKASWDQPFYPTKADVKANKIARVLKTNRETIANSFGPMKGNWGFKDPRTLVTLPMWRAIFPDAKVILISRSPADIARSLTKRHLELIERKIFPAEGNFKKGNIAFTQRCATFDGSLDFALEQLQFLEKLKAEGVLGNHLELSYEALLRDPLYELSRIIRYLGISTTRADVKAAAALPRRTSDFDDEALFASYFKGF